MQISKYALIITLLISSKVFAYECRAVEFKLKRLDSKKNAYNVFSKANRQDLVNGTTYELTNLKATSKNVVKKIAWMLEYLENTEPNSDQEAYFKLLATASDINTKTPRKLELKELCEISEKVNQLVARKEAEKKSE